MALWVKCLPSKSEALSLDPQNLCKKLGMVAYAGNPSSGKQKQQNLGGSQASQPSQSVSSSFSERLYPSSMVKSGGDGSPT